MQRDCAVMIIVRALKQVAGPLEKRPCFTVSRLLQENLAFSQQALSKDTLRTNSILARTARHQFERALILAGR